MTASESYRNAYSTKNMKDSSIWTEASKLMSNPKVSQRVKLGMKRKSEYASTTGLSLRQMVLEQLQKEALDTNNNESSRIRALELLGKVSEVALFTERLETTAINKKIVGLGYILFCTYNFIIFIGGVPLFLFPVNYVLRFYRNVRIMF